MLKKLLLNKEILMVLAVAWTILIFVGCSLPGQDLLPISVFDHFDKVVHFTFFLVFALLWLAVLPGRYVWHIILLSFAYGFALEFYQINFVEGRSWDVWDGVADGVGGIVGCLFYRRFLL